MKKVVPHFVSFAFCAFLSGIAFVGLIGVGSPGADPSWWKPAFFGFLPMCFFFVASNTVRMQREIDELREKVTLLELAAPAKQILKS